MKVLVIGATGFLGTEICKLLALKKIFFNTVSRKSSTTDFEIDIADYATFDVLPKNFFNIIINAATTLPGGNFLDNNYLDKIYKTNILGSQNICKWINEQTSIKKIINCSTLVVVNKPWQNSVDENSATYPLGNHVLYCGSKLMQELLFESFCKNRYLLCTHLRFSSLYGQSMNWSGIICNFIDQAKDKRSISLTNGNFVYADFLNVIDAANSVYVAITNDIKGIVNVASGVETSILQLAQMVASNFSEIITIENKDNLENLFDRAVVSTSKLEQYLNVSEFVKLENGIKYLITK